jgi:hypothetical protein
MSRLRKGGGALTAIAILAGAVVQAAPAAPAPVADYRFQNSFGSSVPGAPQIADVGPGNQFATETIAGCATPVRTFPQHSGLQADLSGVLGGDTTVVLDFRLSDVPQSGDTYERLIGTSDVTSDFGLYVHDGNLDWFNGSGDIEGTSKPIQPNQFVEVALVQRGAPLNKFDLDGYVNGSNQNAALVDTGEQIGAAPRLFKDNDPSGSTDEDSAGAVFRVRFFGLALTPADVAQIYSESLLGTPSQCPAAAASVTRKPKVKKRSGGSILVDTGIQGICPDWGAFCNGTASIAVAGAKKSKSTVLSSVPFSIDRTLTQEVVFGLRSRGKKRLLKLLRTKGKLKDIATVTITGPNGKPTTVTSRGKIKSLK